MHDSEIVSGVFCFSAGALQLAGPQFPNQGLNPGNSSKSPESSLLGHGGTPIYQLCFFKTVECIPNTM